MVDQDDEKELESPEGEGLDLNDQGLEHLPNPEQDTEAPPTNDTDKPVQSPEDYNKELNGETTNTDPKESLAETDESDDGLEPENESSDKSKLSHPTEESALKKYQDFLDEYKRLQQHRRNTDLVTGLMTAGGQIGQAMAGKFSGNFAPDLSGVKAVEQIGNRPVTDFEQNQVVGSREVQLQQEKAAHDPTSPQSKLIRNYLNERFSQTDEKGNKVPLLNDDVSAADAQMLLKSIGKPLQSKFQKINVVNKSSGEKGIANFNPTTGQLEMNGQKLDPSQWVQDYRAASFVDPKTGERMGFSSGTGKTTGNLTGPGVNAPVVGGPSAPGAPVELNRSMLTAQQAKQVDHSRDKFTQEVKDDRNSLNANDRVIAVLQSGGQLGDLPREIQDQLNRAFGQKGHISDAQLGGLLGKPDWKNRVENAVSLGMTGKLTDENRKFLLDVAQLIKQQNQQYIDNKSKIYTQNLFKDLKTSPNLNKYNFQPKDVGNLLSVESAQFQGAPDPKIMEWAKEHVDGDYNAAKTILTKRGYKPEEQ